MQKIWTIARNAKGKNGRGTQAAKATMWTMIMFGLVVIMSIMAVYIYYWHSIYKRYYPDTVKVVVVNAPQEFLEFTLDNPDEYIYKFTNHPYVYDIAKFNELMNKYNASLTVVFPPDSETSEGPIEILTYFPIDSLEYKAIRDEYVDTVLESFDIYIMQNNGVPVSGFKNADVRLDGYTTTNITWGDRVRQDNATSTIPLILFIAIMYLAMSAGTTAISASKEQGTFASILMTPVPRRSIILGYTLHVWIKTLIPIAIMAIPVIMVPSYRAGLPLMLLLMVSLSLFISALTILISTLNDSVVSAQTAFLPIFLIFIILCVTCVQNPDNYTGIYYAIPIYGQFLGTGAALLGRASIGLTMLCVLVTFIFAWICIEISTRLLSHERFTTSTISASDKMLKSYAKEQAHKTKLLKSKATVFGYNKVSLAGSLRFTIMQILRPLGLLAIFQTLSLIPPLLLSDGKGLTEILLSLKDVQTVDDVLSSSASIMSVLMNTPAFLLSMSLGYWLIIAAYIIQVRLVEKQPLSTIGLPNKSIVKRYLLGLVLGFIMIGYVFLILLVSGQITTKVVALDSKGIALFFAFICMWIPQGATEEFMFRGYMISRIAPRYGIPVAIGASSFMFCIFHGLNPGFTWLALINLILISILYALIAIKTDHIWTLLAAHSMWNFAQGNLFGLEVSGNANGASLLESHSTNSASSLWTGGGFGPEGGLAVTIVVVIAIIAVCNHEKKTNTSK